MTAAMWIFSVYNLAAMGVSWWMRRDAKQIFRDVDREVGRAQRIHDAIDGIHDCEKRRSGQRPDQKGNGNG